MFESRTIFVSGEVDSDLAQKVNRQLMAMERANSTAPIVLWIDCPGGEVYSGFSIYDTIRFIQPKVFTVASGIVASMGSVIALAAEKENRLSLPNAKFLIHQPLLSGAIRGSASEIEIHALDILETKRKLHRLYAERTGTPMERFEELMNRDYWIEPQGALELGLISRVVGSRAEMDRILAG